MQTAVPHSDPTDRIHNAVLGLAGEAGEIADAWKKHVYHGHGLDAGEMVNELGDVLWYVTLFADALGVPLGRIMERNIEKLAKRYPDGFSTEASINRGDK
jgi:NTP pyrophosphatase (non-canonical NTP hydrolase)